MATFHRIDYIELCVPSLSESKTFFKNAFGWQFTDYGPDYCGIKDTINGGEMGGMTTEGTGATGGGPLVVLLSEDLEESLERTQKAGGEITKDIFEFPGGRRFEFKEPGGNLMAVWCKAI